MSRENQQKAFDRAWLNRERSELCVAACRGIPDDQLTGLRNLKGLLEFLAQCEAYVPGSDPDEIAYRQCGVEALAIVRGEKK